jgi:predicted MFS family arabinose efflux permease
VPVAVVYTLSWFGVFTFVNAYLKHELNYTSEEWTAVTLWYTGSMVVWPFFCSELSAWLGRRWTVTLAMLLSGMLFIGFTFFPQRLAIGAMLALMALTVAVVSAVWMPMVAAAGGNQPGRALITFNFTNTVIGASALIAGGYAADYLGYRQAFQYCAAACIIGALLFILVTRSFEAHGQTAKVVSLRRLTHADVMALLTGPYLIIVLCGLSMEAFNYHTVNQLWPNLARDTHGMGEKAITTMVALGRLPALLTLTVLAQFIDRVNPLRFYGFSFLYVASCVFTLGLVPNDGALRMAYVAYFIGMGCVWGSNSPSVNAAVSPHLRDSAFALMLVPAQLAVFLVGIFQNRLLAAGVSLPEVFRWCGIIAALGGGVVLIVYSFTRHMPRATAEPAGEPLVEETSA